MKKSHTKLFYLSILFGTLNYAQVGINTDDPKATLEVKGKPTDATVVDGIILPRLSGDELKAKDLIYNAQQTGAIVYATEAVTTSSTKTVNITAPGYYIFNGTVWEKLTTDSNTKNIYTSDGTIPANTNRTITLGNGTTSKLSIGPAGQTSNASVLNLTGGDGGLSTGILMTNNNGTNTPKYAGGIKMPTYKGSIPFQLITGRTDDDENNLYIGGYYSRSQASPTGIYFVVDGDDDLTNASSTSNTIINSKTPLSITSNGSSSATFNVDAETHFKIPSTTTTGTSHFTVDGKTLNVDAVNNRVGIGTSSPGNLLDVTHSTDGNSGVRLSTLKNAAYLSTNADGDIVSTPEKNIYASDGTLSANRTVAQTDKTLNFTSTATTGTSHFTVDGTTLNVNAVNNRVGIGTAAPSENLEVVGSTKISGAVTTPNVALSNNGGRPSYSAGATVSERRVLVNADTGRLYSIPVGVTAYNDKLENNAILSLSVPKGNFNITITSGSPCADGSFSKFQLTGSNPNRIIFDKIAVGQVIYNNGVSRDFTFTFSGQVLTATTTGGVLPVCSDGSNTFDYEVKLVPDDADGSKLELKNKGGTRLSYVIVAKPIF